MSRSQDHTADEDDPNRSVDVLLFAAARTRAGRDRVHVVLPSKATVADLKNALARQFPALEPITASLLVAINETYANDAAMVPTDGVVACFPPVSGG